MSGNHPERCLPPEQSSTPTKDIQSTSIHNLPSEILTKIIERILPEDVPNIYDANTQYCTRYRTSRKLEFRPRWPRPREYAIEHRYAILYTNKRFHAETLRILQARTFHIKIGERALFSANAAEGGINWARDLVFPGLELRNIRELVVEITPTDFWRFWTMVNTALKGLFDQQLGPRGPLKRLRIDLKDTYESNHWRWTRDNSGSLRAHVAAQDYESALQLFREIILSAGHCEIRLPYWMRRSSVAKRIFEEWAKPSVQVRIMPVPGPVECKAQEVGCRGWAELAPLPDSLLP